MPKRKRSVDVEDELFNLMRKVKKLKRKMRRKKYSDTGSDSHEDSPTRDYTASMRSEIHKPGIYLPLMLFMYFHNYLSRRMQPK